MKKELSHDTRERILKAAVKVFIDKGKYGARMQEIADEAQINKAMLHYYFIDKDTLYAKSLEYLFTKLFTKMAGIVDESASPFEILSKLIETEIDFMMENKGFAKVMAREMVDGGNVIKKIFKKLSQKENIFSPLKLKELIDNAMKSGQIRKIDSVQIIISIIGMAVIYFIGKPLHDSLWNIKPAEQEKFINARKASIIDLLMHGLRV